MYFSTRTVAASALLVGSVYGHAIMNTPTPYGFHTLQTSPLNGDNFQFPCQSGSRADAFDATGVNNPAVQAGGFQPVKFTGSAVHGSGSCQFSVTYDFPPPSDPKKWKVIHTIIGGCPSDSTGNIQQTGSDGDGRPTGPQCTSPDQTECLKQFQIPIPKEMPNGKATFAWTWFNDIGNREIYMNCAPIEVKGGSNDKSFLDTLPEMFVANLPGYCTTVEGILNIPNPGQSVLKNREPEAGASGTCAAGGNIPDTPQQPEPAPSSYVEPAPTTVGGIFAPGASSAPAAGPTAAPVTPEVPTTPEVPSVPEVPETPTYPTAPAANLPVPSGASGLDKVACSNEGGVVCMGTDYFGLCDHGFAVKMAVALGTKCENGKVLRRSLPRQHLHARIHGGSF